MTNFSKFTLVAVLALAVAGMAAMVANPVAAAGMPAFRLNSVAPAVSSGNSPALDVPAGSATSQNWSGYVATAGTFTAINGTWTVPTVAASNTFAADATWVGIGGVSSQDLIQAGTQAVPSNSNGGAVQYQAWIELLPQNLTTIPMTVNAGDSISVSINQQSTNQWSIYLHDNTNGQSYQTSVSYDSSMSSAEWIEEMPSTGGNNFVPLDSFGTVSFTGGSTVKNGTSLSIAQANGQELTMINGSGQVLAAPSVLGSDGASFTVTRSNATATSSPTGVVVVRRTFTRGQHRVGVGIRSFTSGTPPMTRSRVNGNSNGATGASSWWFGNGNGSGTTNSNGVTTYSISLPFGNSSNGSNSNGFSVSLTPQFQIQFFTRLLR